MWETSVQAFTFKLHNPARPSYRQLPQHRKWTETGAASLSQQLAYTFFTGQMTFHGNKCLKWRYNLKKVIKKYHRINLFDSHSTVGRNPDSNNPLLGDVFASGNFEIYTSMSDYLWWATLALQTKTNSRTCKKWMHYVGREILLPLQDTSWHECNKQQSLFNQTITDGRMNEVHTFFCQWLNYIPIAFE